MTQPTMIKPSGSSNNLLLIKPSRIGDTVAVICVAIAVFVLAINCVGLIECQEQVNIESRMMKDGENELADTIKYLEKLENLDKYWSEVARPRFGRSKYKQALPLSNKIYPGRQTTVADSINLEQPRQHYYGSLIDLINAKLAQKYYNNDAY